MTDKATKELKRSDLIDALEEKISEINSLGIKATEAHENLGKEIEYMADEVNALQDLLTELKETL